MTERTEFGYKRTVCDCEECTINCRFIPGMMIPSDLVRLKSRIGEGFEDWADSHIAASPGAIVAFQGQMFRIPTLVPARGPDGACIFLKDGKCDIHADSPYGCAFFDSHIPHPKTYAMSTEGLQTILDDWREGGEYARLWMRLAETGKYAPAPEVNRRKIKEYLENQDGNRGK